MDAILKNRNEVYGFLALWIIFFHVERSLEIPIYIPIFNEFIERGNLAVDIFMFLSGFCLCLSLKRNFDIGSFYTKRFKRLIVSYLIIATPFFFWKCFAEFSSKRLAHFLYDLSGGSFWFSGCQNAWFVHAILLFYILTPFLFLIIKKSIAYSFVLLLLIYVGIFIGYYYFSPFKYSSIAWTRLPIFILGLLLAYYKPTIFSRDRKILTLVLIIGLCVCLLLIPKDLPSTYIWLMYAFFVLPILLALSQLLQSTPKFINDTLSILGKVSLEIYICHIMIWHVFRTYKIECALGYWMYLILPAIAIPCSYLAFFIAKQLINIKFK